MSQQEAKEYKATVSYARNLENKFYIGANINFLNSFIKNNNSLGFGVDFGILYEPFDFLRFGFMQHNLIRPIQTIGTEKEGIPQLYVLGILLTKELGFLKINITSDFSMGETENLKIRFGTEFSIYKLLSLRAGYDAGRYVLGSGINILNGAINYTFIINDYLENLHRIDIIYRFGLSLDEQKTKKKNEIMNQVRKIVDEKLKLKEKQMAMKYYTAAYNYYKKGDYENALKEILICLFFPSRIFKFKIVPASFILVISAGAVFSPAINTPFSIFFFTASSSALSISTRYSFTI